MYEKLRGRVSRIISVGVSSVMGAIEGLSPEGVMEETISEVNEAVLEVGDELGRVLAAKHMANKRLTEKTARHEELDEKIAFAVAESRDDLAEAGIAHQLDIEAQLPILRETVEDLNRKEQELHSYISALKAKKREMQEELARLRASRAATLTAAQDAGGTAAAGNPALGDVSSVGRKVANATSAFDRILAHQTGLPASSANLSDQAKLAELDQLNRDNRIKERLLAVKAARGQA